MRTSWYRLFMINLCFLSIHCNPSLAYIDVRDLQSSQRNGVHSHSYWLFNFLYQQQPSAGDGDMWQTFENSWKTHYLMNTLYIPTQIHVAIQVAPPYISIYVPTYLFIFKEKLRIGNQNYRIFTYLFLKMKLIKLNIIV